jgi:copper chaperone
MVKLFISALLIIAFTFTASSVFANETKTVTIKCTEMTCDGCKREITRYINMLDGIEKVDIDLTTKLIKVTFDDKKASEKDLIKAIEDAGYSSKVVE